jgi:hypothetical protein
MRPPPLAPLWALALGLAAATPVAPSNATAMATATVVSAWRTGIVPLRLPATELRRQNPHTTAIRNACRATRTDGHRSGGRRSGRGAAECTRAASSAAGFARRASAQDEARSAHHRSRCRQRRLINGQRRAISEGRPSGSGLLAPELGGANSQHDQSRGEEQPRVQEAAHDAGDHDRQRSNRGCPVHRSRRVCRRCHE